MEQLPIFQQENCSKSKDKEKINSVTHHDSNKIIIELLKYLKKEYGEKIYHIYFKGLKSNGIFNNILRLVVPNETTRNVILEIYFQKIYNFITSKYSMIHIVELYSCGLVNKSSIQVSHSAKQLEISSLLNRDFTFDSFVHDTPNIIAYNAAKELASLNDQSHLDINSLYIQANTGMGKTHLLQSIANHLANDLNVGYFTCDKFSQKYVEAVKSNNIGDFKNYLSQLDILLLDDLQLICGKHGTEKELISTFDNLMEMSRKVVFTSNSCLSQLNLNERTKSRLASCISVKIESPNLNLKIKILENFIQKNEIAMSYGIDSKILNMIAHYIDNDIRNLQSAVKKIIAYCRFADKSATLSLVQNILASCKNSKFSAKVQNSFEDILKLITQYFAVDKMELQSKSRSAKISHARQIAAYLLRNRCSMGIKEIGKILGDRDHSTVVYMLKSINKKNLAMVQLEEINRLLESDGK